MSRKFLVQLVLALMLTPALGFSFGSMPRRGESLAGAVLDAVLGWVQGETPPAAERRGPDGRPVAGQPASTKHGCGIDPWGRPNCS